MKIVINFAHIIINKSSMKATKITIEIGHNNQYQVIEFKNESVFKVIKKIEKEFKGCIIYSVKTEY
jgi:hypothetical protein